MVGPLLGGLLLARLGPAACYLAFARPLARRPRRRPPPGAARRPARRARRGAGPGQPPAAASARSAGTRPSWACSRITVLMNTLVFPYQQMLPVFARDVLRVGPAALGLLVAAQRGSAPSSPSLAIAARGERASTTRALFAGSSLAGALVLLAFAWSPWYALSLALQLAIGAAESGFGTMQSAIVLLAAPEQARGRAWESCPPASARSPSAASGSASSRAASGAPLATGLNAGARLRPHDPRGDPPRRERPATARLTPGRRPAHGAATLVPRGSLD